jgi:RHS repeat-associated protein
LDNSAFETYYRDGTNALDYARNRHYSSTLGRFLTADPYRNSAGPADPGSWNRYAYVGGDPVNWYDPGGLIKQIPDQAPPSGAIAGWVPLMGIPPMGEGGQVFYMPFGGGGGPRRITVTNYSRTGTQEAVITSVLQDLLDNVLSQVNDCSKWLTGKDFSGADFVKAILGGGPIDYTFGHGQLNSASTAAFVGNRNTDGTPVQGLPNDSSITVNDSGAFFNSAFTIGPARYAGGTLAAQAFVLLHEIGHEVGVLASDVGNPAAGRANDALVDKNCAKAIGGLR